MIQINYGLLHDLGLSPLAIRCYACLFTEGSAAVRDLARCVQKPRNSIYPILIRLEQWGFIIKFASDLGPTYYSARPLSQALALYHARQRQTFSDLIRQQEIALALE